MSEASAICRVHFFLCFVLFFSLAVKRMDLSLAYAIRAGIGTALIALIATLFFREGADTPEPFSSAGLAKTIPNTLE
jgi:small multidrug resistance pump